MCFGVCQAAVTLLGVWRDQTSDFDRRSRWLSCGNTQEHMWTCGMKTSLGHWRHHFDSWMFYILHTIEQGCHNSLDSKELFLCRMQKYMNNTRHGDIWTSVRTRQTQPNSPTEACFRACCSEGRCHFFSLRHTLRGYVYGKHECLCSMLWINVVPALIFF